MQHDTKEVSLLLKTHQSSKDLPHLPLHAVQRYKELLPRVPGVRWSSQSLKQKSKQKSITALVEAPCNKVVYLYRSSWEEIIRNLDHQAPELPNTAINCPGRRVRLIPEQCNIIQTNGAMC